MTDDQMAARFDRLQADLDRRFEAIDRRFEAIDRRFEALDGRFDRVDMRLEALEKHSVSKAEVFQTVIVAQGVFYAGAVMMVVVLNAAGAFG